MLKFNFFWLKSWKMLLAVPKNGQFQEKFTKKNRTNFLLDGDFNFFLVTGVYVGKSKRVTNMQNYTPKKIEPRGCL